MRNSPAASQRCDSGRAALPDWHVDRRGERDAGQCDFEPGGEVEAVIGHCRSQS